MAGWSVDLIYTRPPGVALMAMRRGIREGLEEAPKLWWWWFLPGHFENPAKGKYGYAKRSKRSELKKAAVVHHRRPLVYRGGLRQAMMSRSPTITGMGPKTIGLTSTTVRGVKATFRGLPWYTNLEWSIDKAAELTKATDAEANVLGAQVRKRGVELARAARQHKVVK